MATFHNYIKKVTADQMWILQIDPILAYNWIFFWFIFSWLLFKKNMEVELLGIRK